MNVFISGSLAYDRIMDFRGRFSDHILPERIHSLNVSFEVQTFRQSFGGTAGNIAYSLSLLGEQPVVFASAGNDFTEYARWFATHRISARYCRIAKKAPTASAYVITDQADNQITGFFAGAMALPAGPVPARALSRCAIGIISPGNRQDMKRLPGIFKKAKMPYLYDPGQQIPVLSRNDLLNGISGAQGLVANDYELSLIQKKTGLRTAALLQRAGLVITTLGEKGSIIASKESQYRIPPAKPRNTSDPTGAGDAYRAGLIKGLLARYSLPVVGRLASVVSAYSVETYGTQTHSFTWADVRRRYARNFGRLRK